MTMDRRAFLKAFLSTAGAYWVAASATPFAASARAQTLMTAAFPHGVASADPQPDAVLLWTRAVDGSDSGVPVTLVMELSRTEDFAQLVASREMTASADSDHTVQVFVEGLEADTRYFYRFRAGEGSSTVGRTRTAPAADADRPVRFAFVSCQGFDDGFHSAYAHLIAEDMKKPENEQIDFVLHLGDFIYEKTGYKQSDPVVDALLGDDPKKSLIYKDGSPRRVPPMPDGISYKYMEVAKTLADYRHLYKTYLSDPNLQAARARFPFVSTWDDHEFLNNGWQSHGENGGPDVQGAPNQTRKVAANQAWSEYIPAVLSKAPSLNGVANPARDFTPVDVEDAPFSWNGEDAPLPEREPNNVAAINSLVIYRSLRFGAHVDLMISDCRTFRSRPPLPDEWSELYEEVAGPLPSVEQVELADLGETALGGNPPREFVKGGAKAPNPRAHMPVGTCLGTDQKQWLKDSFQSSTATWKLWGNPIPLLPLRVNLDAVPFAGMPLSTMNIDAWDGYPTERSEIARFVLDQGIDNVVSLAGDHHMHMAGTVMTAMEPESLKREGGTARAAFPEFATAGISSGATFRYMIMGAEGSPFAGMIWNDKDGEIEEVVNYTLTAGALSGLTYAQTGSRWLADRLASASHAPYFKYVDTNSTGYGLVEADGSHCTVTLLGFPTPVEDLGTAPSTPDRIIHFDMQCGVRDCPKPAIEGRRVFGMEKA